MYCSHCGQQLPNDARFCEKCGASVAHVSTSGNAAQTPYRHEIKMNNHPPAAGSNGGFNQNADWTYGGGAKFWLGFCAVVNPLMAIAVLLNGYILMGILSIILSIAYILLLLKKISAFYVICAVAVIVLIINIFSGSGLMSILGLGNPLITYLVIKKYYF